MRRPPLFASHRPLHQCPQPTDAEVWAKPALPWGTWARHLGISSSRLAYVMRERGWLRAAGGRQSRLLRAPCARCGVSTPIAELSPMRTHLDVTQCALDFAPVQPTPDADVPEWRRNLEWARERLAGSGVQMERARREMNAHFACQRAIAGAADAAAVVLALDAAA